MPSNYKAITEYNEDQLGKDTSSRKTQVSMYSDPTHFIYEILQNADDYGATEVLFKLSEDNIVIEHNGEPFKEENVKAITYFGKSTSREDLVKTGRFGIGFKSVFAFTATPIIISGPEHFQIYGLYRIKEYPYPEGFSRSRTRIILPFNHESDQPDFVEELISKDEAYQQISKCLTQLDMKTLLFTQNIREIRWEIGEQSECYSREDYEVDHNIRSTKIKDGKHKNKYLVFSKIPTWENKKHKPVEIAFAFNTRHQLSPINDEFLHVLFPTREKTGLRFILNGPYRTNPARETISETDAFNLHLMKVTCELMQEGLPKLRDGKLLTLQFLSILPNNKDNLQDFYTPLLNTVISEFQNEKLTPTKRGDHAAASGLYRVDSELSDLISDEDLAILLRKDCSLPFKVDEITQRRDTKGRFVQDPNAQFTDNFLNTLQIPEWNMTEFISTLLAQPGIIKDWLSKKTPDWHQALYALFHDFLKLRKSDIHWFSTNRNLLNGLSNLPIVCCSDNIYRTGGKCYFPSDDVVHDERFPRVLKGVYSSGGDEVQQSKASDFLEAIGVRPVDEAVEIEAILEQRYVEGTIELRKSHYKRDLERFMAFVEKEQEPDKAKNLFAKYHIFKSDKEEWGVPSKFCLDSPYCDTGLALYYAFLESINEDLISQKLPFSPTYKKLGIDIEKFMEFAKALGVETKLKVTEQSIPRSHPEYDSLINQALGDRFRQDTGINKDYTISGINDVLSIIHIFSGSRIDQLGKVLSVVKLIWRTMCDESPIRLQSTYRKSLRGQDRVGASTLVHALKNGQWVPQEDGDSLSFVSPKEASVEHLPREFQYDREQEWLKAIQFGEIRNKQNEEYIQRDQNAKKLGFDAADTANTMAKIANICKEQGSPPEVVLQKLRTEKRRKELLIIELDSAPEKEYETRARSIRSTHNSIDQDTMLRERYTDEDNEMSCQMCLHPMPFKKRNSDDDYFEAVEALGKNYFFKEHEAQYLALCPECAAQYKEFIKRDQAAERLFYDELRNSDEPKILVESNGVAIQIQFEEKHWQDLKVVLHYYDNVYNPDESD